MHLLWESRVKKSLLFYLKHFNSYSKQHNCIINIEMHQTQVNNLSKRDNLLIRMMPILPFNTHYYDF